MVWEPFALAVGLGLLVSAALYFTLAWPEVEPDEPTESTTADDTSSSTAAEAIPD